ncbi:MAG: hypothetical protein HYZ13_05200 [Acidobacteria bacterium]|nr:hypothetical protein [Acidobacteriota bacterium]
MEFDELKASWDALNARLDQQGESHRELLREHRMDRARRGLRPLAWGQGIQMVCGALLILFSASFWVDHRAVPHLFAMGLVMHLYGLGLIVFGARMHYLLGHLDFGAPVLELQARVARLRRFYVVGGMWIGLPWWFLWMPFMTMIFKAFFGVDMATKAPAVWVIGTAVGLAGCLVTYLIVRYLDRRPDLTRKQDDAAAGRGLTQAQRILDELARFDRE